MRVLTWNLFHGRSVPDTRRSLLPEFAAMLAGWDWDVALLQEVPPWWPVPLGAACDARALAAPTSRNQLLALTRPAATRRPDLVKSWGGGCNAILVRGRLVTDHRRLRLRLAPERRVMHAVRLGDGVWVGNLHASAHVQARAVADLARAGAVLDRWSAGDPAILGGDTNVRGPQVPGYTDCGGHVLDHVFARDLAPAAPAATLPRHVVDLGANLSDHRPVLATLAEPPAAHAAGGGPGTRGAT